MNYIDIERASRKVPIDENLAEAEEVARISQSISQASGVSMNEATQTIYSAMRALHPPGDVEIAMIRNNPSLNIFQKWLLIRKIEKWRKHEFAYYLP